MIYVCAGMYRSGSTWLYNAVRLTLLRAGVPGLAAGWIADKDTLLQHENSVVKIHAFDEELAAREDAVVLTSHRDLRDVMASLHRKFKIGFSVQPLHETVESHDKWSRLAAFDLHYEDLLADRVLQVRKIASVLRLPVAVLEHLPYESISREIDAEEYFESRSTGPGYDEVNLLHEGHITDGRHGSWRGCVSDEILMKIEVEFRPWLMARGYPVPSR